jgi:UDP-N-acetylmuramate dehydrogenase
MDLHALHRVDLKPFNTFGLSCIADRVVEVRTEAELVHAVADEALNASISLVLGGGSNLLFTRDHLAGTVLHVALLGRHVVAETDDWVVVEGAAGEPWHDFVRWTLDQGWGGLENLSLIPGNVGTTPIQNVGAYGVETKDVCHSVRWVERGTGKVHTFSPEACRFGYRESIFKGELRNRSVVAAVQFKLTKNQHAVRTHYGSVDDELASRGEKPTPKNISDAVIRIRKSKLPDPAELGNSGSFFKNPTVSADVHAHLVANHPSAPGYPQPDGRVKLAAGWLIEQAGWKGFRRGDAGVHTKQALVLVNYGGATGPEIWQLAQDIVADVHARFGVLLEPEVNVIA